MTSRTQSVDMTGARVDYFAHAHARMRMQTRMAAVGVIWSDVLAVISTPTKMRPGDFGRFNVTYHPVTGEVRTVAIADSRYLP